MTENPDPSPHWKFWPPGVPHEIDIGDRTLWDVLADAAQAAPARVALDFLGRSLTRQQLLADATALAGALQSLGLQPGGRVVLLAQNCPQFVIAFHAILRAGGVVVPVNPMNKAREIEHCLRDSGARIAISARDLAGELVKASDSLGAAQGLQHLVHFGIGDSVQDSPALPAPWRDWLLTPTSAPAGGHAQVHAWQDLVARQQAPDSSVPQADDLALLMYTSGTTGHPKACMHSHRTIMANAIQPRLWQDLQEDDVALVALPLFHITGLVGGLLGSMCSGARVVLLPRWDRRVAATAIAAQRVTHWTNIPTMVVDLLAAPELGDFDLSSLRYIGGGGASMPEAVANELKRRFGLDYVEGYGLTETAAPSHSNPRQAPRFQCLGIPIINTRARVIDPDTLQALGPDQHGEIVVDGPQVFRGYWNNPEATAAAFVELEGRRWFRTGDLGRMDKDGYYYIADRLKRMINASGFKVWPAEVESLLHQHPAVQEACIIALHDAYRGQSVKAAIVLRPALRDSTTAQDIIDWARQNMAAYKVPREVEFLDALPKGGTGKVMWRVLQTRQDELQAR